MPLPASSDTIAVDRTGPDSGRLRFTSGAEMLKLWTAIAPMDGRNVTVNVTG